MRMLEQARPAYFIITLAAKSPAVEAGCPRTATRIRDNLLHFAAILSSMNSTCGFRYPRSHMNTLWGTEKTKFI